METSYRPVARRRFEATHNFYIAAFSRGVGFLPSRAALAGVAASAALALLFIWPGIAWELKAPVAASA